MPPLGQYAVLDSAGQFTTDPTDYYDDGMVSPRVSSFSPYETESGVIISTLDGDIGGRLSLGITNKYLTLIASVSSDTFVGQSLTATSVMRWRDYVVLVGTGGSRTALVKYSVSDFDKYASEMAEYYGVVE